MTETITLIVGDERYEREIDGIEVGAYRGRLTLNDGSVIELSKSHATRLVVEKYSESGE